MVKGCQFSWGYVMGHICNCDGSTIFSGFKWDTNYNTDMENIQINKNK